MQDEQVNLMDDDLIKREQLSALVDGEADSVHMQAVLSFAESDEGQQSWRMYHLIGDVLRSPELAHHSQHDILSGVRAHMEREPIQGIRVAPVQTVAAEQRDKAPANASVFRWKMAAGFASVAAVAAVGWGVMVAGDLAERQGRAQLAALNPGAAVQITLGAEAQSSPVVAVSGPNGQSVMLRDPRLDELLASQSPHSSAPNLQMPASFLRNASFATATRH